MTVRRRLVATLAGVAALLAGSAAPAGAQAIDERLVAERDFAASATGELVVAFRSDPATCAVVGRCGLDGVVAHRPGTSGELSVRRTVRRGGAATTNALLTLFEGVGPAVHGQTGTRAQVRRVTPFGSHVCTDVHTPRGDVSATAEGTTTPLGLAGAGVDLLATRCAGPALADVGGLLPAPRVGTAPLPRAGRTLDLRGAASFTAAGLTGTVRSTVVVRLGRAGRDRDGVTDAGGDQPPVRRLEVRYVVERVAGALSASFSAPADPAECTLLDACGLTGTLALTPERGRQAVGALVAVAPARLPRARVRAALGLVRGSTRGVIGGVSGLALFGGGRLRATAALPGVAMPCVDERPVEAAIVEISAGRTGPLRATFSPAERGGPDAGLRTRCPGPFAAESVFEGGASVTSVPRTALRGRRLVLRFAAPRRGADPALPTTIRPDVTVTLRRAEVRERVFDPDGPDPEGRLEVQVIR